jgi:hypothetical protein
VAFIERRRREENDAKELVDNALSCYPGAFDQEGERIAWPFAIGGDKRSRAAWIDQNWFDLELPIDHWPAAFEAW